MSPDPVLPCDVEKFVLANGSEFMIERPRIVQSADGRTARGYVVAEDGRTTQTAKAIIMKDVTRHVAMGWRNSDQSLHEMPALRPASVS